MPALQASLSALLKTLRTVMTPEGAMTMARKDPQALARLVLFMQV
jgi:hypothetical protein